MIEYEYYDWTQLISERDINHMCRDVENGIRAGKFWHNSPKYQTNWSKFMFATFCSLTSTAVIDTDRNH